MRSKLSATLLPLLTLLSSGLRLGHGRGIVWVDGSEPAWKLSMKYDASMFGKPQMEYDGSGQMQHIENYIPDREGQPGKPHTDATRITRFSLGSKNSVQPNQVNGSDIIPRTNSGRADLYCPDAAVILPCVCTVYANDNIDLDCTEVESEEQLAEVFRQEFPVTELDLFFMTNNSEIKVLRDILNGVTFKRIFLYEGPFALEAISELFFFGLKNTLQEIRIENSQLTTDLFPFVMLPLMEKLEVLHISLSPLTFIPKPRGQLLNSLAFVYTPVEAINEGTFLIGPGPMKIYLDLNQIHTIDPGSFIFADQNSADSNEAIFINLGLNKLHSLQEGILTSRDGPTTFWLYGNQISSIEPGTFALPGTTEFFNLTIWLDFNNLTMIDEAVFGEVMPFTTELRIVGNPLSCGCDIAWLVLDPSLLDKVDRGAACVNGTNLHDLHPQDYVDFC